MNEPRIMVLDYRQVSSEYPAVSCRVNGRVSASFGRGHTQWAVSATLAEGAEISWDDAHGDEAIYVFEGELAMDGQICPERGSVIVECGVPATVRATRTARIIHFGPADPAPLADGPLGAAEAAGHTVRIVPEAASNPVRHVGPDGTVYDQRFYADSTRPTCRLALFGVTASQAAVAPIHHHTQDEIIHVVRGELHVGKLVIAAGQSIAIKARQRYGFAAPGLLEFLNYRKDASYVVQEPNPPQLETAAKWSGSKGID